MKLQRIVEKTITVSDITGTEYSETIDLDGAKSLSIQCVVDVDTPGAKNYLAGEAEIQTVTFDTKANSTAGDHVVLTDGDGVEWAISLDVTGSDAEPTAASWTAVAAGKKAHVDISGATTAADVAALVETDFDALTDLSSSFTTSDAAADGTFVVTSVVRGPCVDAVVSDDDGMGAGSITVAETNAGVASTVDVTEDTLTIASHGLPTGLKGQLTTTGTLPAGSSTSTDYFVIVVDANTIQLAASLANAVAGTAIDLTDQGTDGGTHTFTPTSLAGASVALQKSNDASNFDTVGSVTSITADGNKWLEKVDPEYRYARLVYTLTAGSMSTSNHVLAKG